MIVEQVDNHLKSKIKQWPCKSNRASELGHECMRYLVLNRTRWQEKTLHDVGLQRVFNEGHLHEPAVIRLLEDSGFQILDTQRAFSIDEYNITGHIDGKIVIDGDYIPFDVKTSSPFVFNTLNDVSDLYNGKYGYLRKYPAQLQLYMHMTDSERGVFIFKNKVNGALKEIWIDYSQSEVEALLEKAEQINRYVDGDGSLPPCIDYDDFTCGSCGYLHICTPEIKRDAIEITDDPELEIKLDRLKELEPQVKEANSLKREFKKIFSEREKVVIGNHLITGKFVDKKGFTVKASRYWSHKIQTIKGA